MSIEKTIFAAADKMRGSVDAGGYKHIGLGLLFLRYVSVSFNRLHDELTADPYSDPEDRDEYTARSTFWVPEKARWSTLTAKAKSPDIGILINDAMREIEAENPSLKGALPKVFGREALDKSILTGLIELFTNQIKLEGSSADFDLIGRIYEYCIGEFASSEGRRGGEFYTPKSFVDTLIEPTRGRVYDPCCGTGGFFVQDADAQSQTLAALRDSLLPRLMSGELRVGDATAEICKFLDIDTLAGTVLNAGHDQRLIFIAANFRKEVTSTVLWLREHKIDARCIKVTPYRFGDEVFIDLQPVIPTREAAEFMISMAEKETEEKSAQVEQHKTEAMRLEYWGKALVALKAAHVGLYGNISPAEDHWLSASSGISQCNHALILLKRELRVELKIGRYEAEENKWLFDKLIERKVQIEAQFGHPIEWLRLDNKKSSRLQFRFVCDGYDRDRWDEYVAWHVAHIQKWEKALKGPIHELAVALKARESAPAGVAPMEPLT